MTDTNITQQPDIGGVASNAFGEHYLFNINRDVFQGTDASTVFRSYFGESLFDEDAFYIIVGTDSGLLYQYIKAQGVPKGSRYLFLELPNVLSLLENMDDPKKELVVTTGENWLVQADEMEIEKYALMGRLTLLRSLGVVHGHYSLYPPFWREIKGEYDAYVENMKIVINLRPFIICQLTNLTENQIPATCLKDAFKGKTAVVLAGGPSLDKLLPWVRQHRKDLLVIAVSRISRSLLDADIQPDISVSVDPQAFNLSVCKDMLEFQDGTLLVNSYHLSPNLLASWGGQKVFMGSRYPWPTPKQPEYMPSGGGTTVTNSALQIAVITGVTQIILGGADFCFSQEGFTHASGTAEHAIGPMPQLCDQQVETNNGMMADTENGYMESARHIDELAQNVAKQGCIIINPAPGAMRLPHIQHLSVNLIQITPQEKTAREIISGCVPPNEKNTRIRLYKEELEEVDRIIKELINIKELARKGLIHNSKIRSKTKNKGRSFNQEINSSKANKVNRIEEQLRTKYNDTVNFIKQYDIIRLSAILRLKLGEVDDNIKNNKIYFQALIDTSDELSGILRVARTRILSRLEEEKPQPTLQILFDQWTRDEQPGRAVLWLNNHKEQVSQLPEEQQQTLHEFQDKFHSTIKKLGHQYIESIEKDTDLDGVSGRAREYFLCQDKNGVLRILAALEKHKDQAQAKKFIPLLQGYHAELCNNPKKAIDKYQDINKGPVHLDALMRLFALYTNSQDWEHALEVLKNLSNISTTYSAMYADFLYANGDVDTAVEIYTEYLLNNPDDLGTMMKLGKVFQQCGSIEGVEWTMRYILGKDPDNHTAQKMLNETRLNKSL